MHFQASNYAPPPRFVFCPTTLMGYRDAGFPGGIINLHNHNFLKQKEIQTNERYDRYIIYRQVDRYIDR